MVVGRCVGVGVVRVGRLVGLPTDVGLPAEVGLPTLVGDGTVVGDPEGVGDADVDRVAEDGEVEEDADLLVDEVVTPTGATPTAEVVDDVVVADVLGA